MGKGNGVLDMIRINIKPLSVNKVWQGKRFKTKDYKDYEKTVLMMLKPLKNLNKPFKIDITFGFSSPLSDIDNPIKPFLDILQKKYSINDKDIFELNVKKELVGKNEEFIEFNIVSYE